MRKTEKGANAIKIKTNNYTSKQLANKLIKSGFTD